MDKQPKQEKAHLIETKKVLDDFPTLESMMFGNKTAIRNHKKKKNYKNKPK